MTHRVSLCLTLLLFLSACRYNTPPPTAPDSQVLGMMELTLSGLGSNDLHVSSRMVGDRVGDLETSSFTEGIDLRLDSRGSFDLGSRGAGGVRYIYATFEVRNAVACEVPGTCPGYGVPRQNLSLVGVDTATTIGSTALSRLERFDGSPADPALALQIRPTHGMRYEAPTNRAEVEAVRADFQAFSEEEAAAFNPGDPRIISVLPYGFVARHKTNPASRAMAANPAAGVFTHVLTVAIRLPLQATAADDPFSISMLFLITDAPRTRVTESLEEQGRGTVEARADALNAEVLLLGNSPTTVSGNPLVRLCRVRTAGTPAAPEAFLVDSSTGFCGDLPPVTARCTIPQLPAFGAVTQTVGDGTPASCSEARLREAVTAGGHIVFNCGAAPHTIRLAQQIEVNHFDRLTVVDGGGLITLDGQGQTRIFRAFQRSHLVLQGLRFINGATSGSDLNSSGAAVFGGLRAQTYVVNSIFENNRATGTGEVGGALYSRGGIGAYTAVINSVFRNNEGNIGGGINNLLANLEVVNTVFEGNRAEGTIAYGGAIYTDGGESEGGTNLGMNNGFISICGSTFRDNRARGQGGGAFVFVYGRATSGQTDTIRINDSLFIGNTISGQGRDPASGGDGFDGLGGGLRSGNGALTLTNSSFINNLAGQQGGAVWLGENAAVSISNITVYGNRAERLNGTNGIGGGIALGGGSINISNSTIVNNHAGNQGGAFWGGENTSLNNSIVAYNTAANNGNPFNVRNNCPRVYAGTNVLEFPQRNLTNTTDTNCIANPIIAEPGLDSEPRYQGGFTPTLALLFGSPAINAANPTFCPATDQRGAARVGTCDIGAFEFQP